MNTTSWGAFSIQVHTEEGGDLIVALMISFVLGLLLPVTLSGQGTAQQEAQDLILRPGDAVLVEIWREEDLSGDFRVDETGALTLPLIGRHQVTESTWASVRERLMERYLEQLRNPSITLTPLRRIYVLGEVNQPGLYAVDPTLSLAGAVALAGGATSTGDLNRLKVVREGQTILEDVSVESALVSAGVRSGDQIFIGRRGWFERNTTFLITAALSLTSVIVSLASR